MPLTTAAALKAMDYGRSIPEGPHDWAAMQDEKGQTFYYNKRTGG
jgi:hypothetical protein